MFRSWRPVRETMGNAWSSIFHSTFDALQALLHRQETFVGNSCAARVSVQRATRQWLFLPCHARQWTLTKAEIQKASSSVWSAPWHQLVHLGGQLPGRPKDPCWTLRFFGVETENYAFFLGRAFVEKMCTATFLSTNRELGCQLPTVLVGTFGREVIQITIYILHAVHAPDLGVIIPCHTDSVVLIQGAHVTCCAERHGHGCTDAEECAPRAVIGGPWQILARKDQNGLASTYSIFLNQNDPW